eukprot:4624172-Amphidinium_carterae.1
MNEGGQLKVHQGCETVKRSVSGNVVVECRSECIHSVVSGQQLGPDLAMHECKVKGQPGACSELARGLCHVTEAPCVVVVVVRPGCECKGCSMAELLGEWVECRTCSKRAWVKCPLVWVSASLKSSNVTLHLWHDQAWVMWFLARWWFLAITMSAPLMGWKLVASNVEVVG